MFRTLIKSKARMNQNKKVHLFNNFTIKPNKKLDLQQQNENSYLQPKNNSVHLNKYNLCQTQLNYFKRLKPGNTG